MANIAELKLPSLNHLLGGDWDQHLVIILKCACAPTPVVTPDGIPGTSYNGGVHPIAPDDLLLPKAACQPSAKS
jgi:hypothetical protein